jgi:hypothetical protein
MDVYDLDAAGETVLAEACRSLDRADQARAIVSVEGVVVRDRFGQVRPHPGVAIERDARSAAVHALDVLGLESIEEARAVEA